MLRPAARLLLIILPLLLGACALLPDRDPLLIDVVGIEPLSGQELEVRMAVKLRVQNPNDTPLDYDGVALRVDVNNRLLASGVSNMSGRIERFDEVLLVVPVSISAFSALRQALGLAQGQALDGLPYTVRGKLSGGVFGTRRFEDSGTFDLRDAAGNRW